MTIASPATTFAARLVDELSRLGVRHAVVAPGSRSQALALALAELEDRGGISVHVRVDERDAGFLALGLALESRTPSLVVTTSGTAVANLMPAVLEAAHSGVPMIVLSADRPAVLRGTGSNQTTWQPGLFGRFIRLERDVAAPTAESMSDPAALAAVAVTASTGVDAGPVHLNLQFAEPLSGAHISDLPVRDDVESVPTVAVAAPLVRLEPGPRTVVVAGAGAGEAAAELAGRAGWPLIAEPSSGSRFGPDLVVSSRELLDDPEFGGRIERVVVFGRPTLSRQVPALLARPGVQVIVVRGAGEPVLPRPDALVASQVTAEPLDRGDREARAWLGRWVSASRRLLEEADDDIASGGATREGSGGPASESGTWDLAERRDYARGELAALRAPITRRALALAVWRASWPHDRLVLGASRLIRELDAVAPGKRIPVLANRGLAGIDGTVSTALGVALASQGSAASTGERVGVTRVLLGDLAMLHDVGGLLVPRGETRPRVQVIVGDDRGGTIFDSLEVARTADPDAFDRMMVTPHDVDIAALASAYGWAHQRVEGRGALDQALTGPPPGLSILEVPLER